MADKDKKRIKQEALRNHPLVRDLCSMAEQQGGVPLLMVHASKGEWRQVSLSGGHSKYPDFCRLMQSSPRGGRQCRLCHVMMTVAACSGGAVSQRCHSGATALVAPVAASEGDHLAVVSSCMFAEEGGWACVAARGKELGIDPDELRRTYFALPEITQERQALLLDVMNALGRTLSLLMENEALRLRLQQVGEAKEAKPLDMLMRDTTWAVSGDGEDGGSSGSQMPLVVRVARELVDQRPDLQFGVKELAAAARVTPNYFSALFHTHVGVPFVTYQTDTRMRRAQKLLADLTLNIAAVARLVGYEDAGYFARRFRQKTGVSPTRWRNKHRGQVQPR
jgi:AraC-like DNA-binding protein/ligand-binding sensor protein